MEVSQFGALNFCNTYQVSLELLQLALSAPESVQAK